MKFLGLEVGSWADWFGAVGTIVAVCVALLSVRREDKKSIKKTQLQDLILIHESLVEIRKLTKNISELRSEYERLSYDNDCFGKVENVGNKIFNFKVRKRIEDLQLNIDLLTLSDRNNELIKMILTFRLNYLYCLGDFINVKDKINYKKNVEFSKNMFSEFIDNLNKFENKLNVCLENIQREIRHNKI